MGLFDGIFGLPDGQGGLLGTRDAPSGLSSMLGAVGAGLISSPRNNMLQNMPAYMLAFDKQDRDARERKETQGAMFMSLVKGGMDKDTALSLSRSPQAVNTWLQQERMKKEDARDARDHGFRQSESQRQADQFNRSFSLQEQQANRPEIFGSAEAGFHEKPRTSGEAPRQIIAPVAPRQSKPASILEYEYTMEQRKAQGLPIIPMEKWRADEAAKSEQGKPLPGEMATRFGLAEEFFRRYDKAAPKIREGAITGPIDSTMAYFGAGEQGAIQRDLKLGSEALFRLLTGAGSGEQEARRQADQYLPSPTDGARTAIDKSNRLRDALRSAQRDALRGRMPQDQIDKQYPMFEGAGQNEYQTPAVPTVPRTSGPSEREKRRLAPGNYNWDPNKGLYGAQ
jgi:hypothetical protein